MNARLQQLWAQLTAFVLAQPPARRALLAGVGFASIGVVLGLAWWVQRPLYRPLFTNLSERDAGAIVETLRTEKVPFRLDEGGRAVLVPAEELYELRLALASRGLPEGGGVGFELFDRQSLGQSDFLQRLNYRRALQGELGRTISQLGGVESARVHLALPERSLFVAQDRQPSASVVVRLAAGRTLSRTQIDGVVHLVAASVEGLAAEYVTVIDEGGRMLTPDRAQGALTGASSAVLDYQLSLERQLAERVESMLGAVVGRDKTLARVAATLDFARVERTEEIYDPDRTAVRTQRTTKEQTTGESAATAPQGPRTERRDESQSYEVSKVVSRTVAPVGVVKQLSVAVLIDGTYSEERGERSFIPRPQRELDRLRDLVKSAVGFSEARGDKIEIASVPFQAESLPAEQADAPALDPWVPALLTRLAAVAFAAAMLVYVVRPLVLGLATASGTPRAGRRLAPSGRLTQENLALTQQHPERAAQLVREWLREAGPRIPPGA